MSEIFDIEAEEFCGKVTCELMSNGCKDGKLSSKYITFETDYKD